MTNIMFQGTASSVGKSLLAAAVCRILKNEGYNVAPFKSQNMSLNSFVTKNGLEMGRAQVVQAEAAKIEPLVEMNPILLKPTSDVGSQVILNGKVYKNNTAKEYYKKKDDLKNLVKEAYEKLAKDYEVIVLEGAGSCAEINLRDKDLVNMGMAKMVDSPVILVGDIDRGGVFASIYGSVMLLSEDERKRIKGFIINKFRGDVNLLKPGIKMLEEKINIPCLGVIPYSDINIDDEDSVTDRFKTNGNSYVTIGVIKLPYISNFTDFTPLVIEKDVTIKYITNKDEVSDVDLIIIPGSKNTIKDMKFIKDSGIDKEIYKKHKEGTKIIGICGGYQMLGKKIYDPRNIESSLDKIAGLSLLDTTTTIMDVKETKQVSGRFLLSNNKLNEMSVKGYEIHMGETKIGSESKPLIQLDNGNIDGAINMDGDVFGTYLHGIFENDDFRQSIIKNLKTKKGLSNESNLSYKELKEKEYENLAKIVKDNLDIKKLKLIMGI
ncbi:MAG: cobyric acid synthase [Firmicutes bacterium]|nr:cobyric acid synthase [Bacillota bacterium]